MSKVGGALPSWYWPAGIPRRVPVAQQPLGRLFRQRFATMKDRIAVADKNVRITYGELLEQSLSLAGGIQTAGLTGTIAISDPDPLESLRLCLAGLFAGRRILLADPADSPELLAARLAEGKASALITSDGAGPAQAAGVAMVARSDLQGTFSEAGTAIRATEPAILLPSGRGLVAHSHFSVSAMAASMAAFIPRLREIPFVCTEPAIGSWEMLTGILLAISQGKPVVFASLEEFDAGELTDFVTDNYMIIQRSQADAMLAGGRIPPMMSQSAYVFVSTGSFDPRWRRHMEALCGRPIFPLWGLPEVGPLVAAHPTWIPPHGHGFPLVNVSLIPIDPDSGKVSIVPWEMLDQAEVGVEALSAMVGYVEPARNVGVKSGTAVRTRQVATMDHVGVVVLQGAPFDGLGAAGAN
ncbi:AMP-binding protein [Candidatus Binatus sp.]|uniref:AMP-binding protein n=1 Tax=Candidatus Binatus sp. TaxID=2811406 RepID=UPI002F959AE8